MIIGYRLILVECRLPNFKGIKKDLHACISEINRILCIAIATARVVFQTASQIAIGEKSLQK